MPVDVWRIFIDKRHSSPHSWR